MNSENRIRDAFDDLDRRTRAVDPRYSLQRMRAPEPPRRGWVPALVGAAAVVAVIGVVAVSGFLSGPDDEVVTDSSNTTVATVSDTTEPTTTSIPVTTTTLPASSVEFLPTHRVTGVAADDVLNVRREPGAGGELYAELPPNYLGVRLVDNVAVVEDGGEWWRVELLDPVRLTGLDEPLHGGPITGWVNSAFLQPYDPSLPEVEPCTGEIGAAPSATGPAPDHVYALRQFGLGGCVRVVVTFGSGFDETFPTYDTISTDVRPAGVPGVRLEQVNGTTVVVLPGVPHAWATQSSVDDSSVAFAGRWTDGSFAIYVTVPGFTSVRVDPDTGQLVIDVTPSGEVSPTGAGFHLLGPPVVGRGGTVEVWGVARPFEATIGTILRRDGEDLDGVGPPYVMTNDYTEAWGLFTYRVSGLEPGAYELALRQDGAGDVVEFALPFTIPDRDVSETVDEGDLALTDRLRAFARGEIAAADVPLAPTLTVSLGVDHERAVSDPNEPSSWEIDVQDWNGYAGPFDVLGPLRRERGITTTVAGGQPHCAAPPVTTPSEWEAARRLSIQPAGITSCLEWYAVDVFVDGAGRVTRVMLDLWEP